LRLICSLGRVATESPPVKRFDQSQKLPVSGNPQRALGAKAGETFNPGIRTLAPRATADSRYRQSGSARGLYSMGRKYVDRGREGFSRTAEMGLLGDGRFRTRTSR